MYFLSQQLLCLLDLAYTAVLCLSYSFLTSTIASSSVFSFIESFWPCLIVIDLDSEAFAKSISEFGYGSDLIVRDCSKYDFSFLKEVLKFGNLLIDKVPFHFKFIEICSGLLYPSCVSKGIGKGIYKVTPKAFTIFSNAIAPLSSFLSKDVGLFFNPIINLVSIEKSKKVGALLV
jgi:hypothetical protein